MKCAGDLELVREITIRSLLKDERDRRYEASGVHAKDGWLSVVFDNDLHLLRTRADWDRAGEGPRLISLEGTAPGYEEITYHPATRRWYCLIEAGETPGGDLLPRVDVFDESFAFIECQQLDFPLREDNKGFEGLAVLTRGGEEYLLGLCEGNGCRGGSDGARPGKGRIQVFRQAGHAWEHAGRIKLPGSVKFADYAGLDIRNGRMAVVSQASSATWIGRIKAEPADWEDLFEDDGRIHLFPRDERGRVQYCTMEGIAWLDDTLLVVVSDRVKDVHPKRCSRHDQSIHIFRIPQND